MQPVGGVSQRSGNQWMKQEYVLEVPGQWPRRMAFTIFGEDRIKQFALQQGEQNVTIQFDIDAHEYQGRWYNEIRAYNVLRAYAAPPVTGQPAYPQGQPAAAVPVGSPAGQPFPPAQAQMPFPPQVNAQGQPVAGQQGKDDLPF